MIDDVINKLLSMPVLELTENERAIFLSLTAELSPDNITPASFASLKFHLGRPLTLLLDTFKINAYLRAWNELCVELRTFMQMITMAWWELYDTDMDGGDFLPIIFYFMPRDELKLQMILKELQTAINIKKSSADEEVYYFTVLYAAADGVLNEIRTQKPNLDADDEKKYSPIAACLRNHEYYLQACLVIKLSDFCLAHEYFEWHTILTCKHSHTLDKLIQFSTTYSPAVPEGDSEDGHDDVDIELNEDCRHYLGIPEPKKLILINNFFAVSDKVPMKVMITCLNRKLKLLEQLSDSSEPSLSQSDYLLKTI